MLWQLQKGKGACPVFQNILKSVEPIPISKCVPKRAGEKSHHRKPRKMKHNIQSQPITTINTRKINTHTDPELDVEKQLGI